MNITHKLLLPTVIGIVLVTVVLVALNVRTQNDLIEQEQDIQLRGYYNSYNSLMAERGRMALAMATNVANDPQVQATFAARDRETLIALFLPDYEVLSWEFGVPQFHFHTPPATAFLRLYALDQYGDDLSDHRQTVVDANTTLQPQTGLEMGRGGLGVRSVVPIFYQEVHIGSVEYGMNFGQPFVDQLKSRYGVDVGLYLTQETIDWATFAPIKTQTASPLPNLVFYVGTRETDLPISADDYQAALAGEQATVRLSHEGEHYVAIVGPLLDYSGNAIGVVEISRLCTATVREAEQMRYTAIRWGLGIALVAALAAWGIISKSVLAPLTRLTQAANQIRARNWEVQAPVASQDEIGRLAQTFNLMTAGMRDLVQNLEQHVAERTRALSVSEKRFRDVAESTADWIWETDGAGRYTYCSEGVVNVLGYTPEEILSKTPFEFMSPDEAARVGQVLAEIAADKQPIVDLENRNLTKDGDEVVLLTNGVPILDSEGYLLGYRGVDKDITERKRAEREIEERRMYLEAVLGAAPDAIVTLDARHRIVEWNSGAERLFGYSREEVLGQGIDPLITNPDTFEEAVGLTQIVMSGDDVPPIETVRYRKDDSPVDVLLGGSPILMGDEFIGVVAVYTDITERKRAEEALHRRNLELAALNAVGDVITSTLDLRTMQNLIIDKAVELLQAEAGSLWLVDQDTGELVCEITADPDAAGLVGTRLPPGTGVVGAVVQEGKPIVVGEAQTDRRWYRGFDDQTAFTTCSIIAVPMVSRGRTIGAIELLNRRDGVAFTGDDERLLAAIGQQIGVAVENARLYEEARQRERQARALYEAGQLAARLEGGLEVGLQTFFERLTGVGDFDRWWVPLLDEDGLTMQGLAGRWEDVPDEQMKRRVVLAEEPRNPVVIVIQNREMVMINDPKRDERLADLPENIRRTAGKYVTVPMVSVSGERVIGALSLGRPISGRDVSADDVDLAHMLAGQVALVIENAHLFEETQRRVRELRLLHDVGLAAASGVRLEEMLQAAAVALAVEFEGTRVGIGLLDPESGVSRLDVSVGYSPDVAKNLRLRPGEGITGWVAQHGEPVLVPDVRLDPRYIEMASDIRSELCVPLSTDARVIGVLNVESPQPNAFTEGDQRLLSTLASNLAVLIERARLFEEVEAARNESQQRAEALEEANVRLQELDRLKSEFLANMSHELRTPLNSVIGFSEVLIDGLVGEVTSDQEECLGNIRSSGKHLLALINDILDLSKIEAGRVELKMATFDVAGLLAEVEVTISPLIDKKSQVLKVEQADGLPPLTADRFRIKQVLLNLLSNAHKFTLVEGHIRLCCRLVDQATMLFSVTDTGIGIKPEDQRIIFDEFRQADGSAAREVTGTGLGLAISRRLVEMHGGRIWVESEYGHGATFSLLLPLAGPPAAELRMAGEREIT